MQKAEMTRYLLRQMSPSERSEFEDRYFHDSQVFEELIAVEDEMIRGYLSGAGSEQERKEFAERFLSTPAGRKELEITEALLDYAASNPTVRIQDPPAPRTRYFEIFPKRLAAAAWLVPVAACLWLVIDDVHLRRELGKVQSDQISFRTQQEQLRSQLEHEIQLARLKPPEVIMSPVTLTAGLTRHTAYQKPLTVPRDVSAVRLRLALDRAEYSRYRASLETADGSVLWHRDDLTSQPDTHAKPAIAIELPKTILPAGDYVLRLFGMTPGGSMREAAVYAFRIANE